MSPMEKTYPYLILLAEDDADDQYFLEQVLREIDPLITLSVAKDGLYAMDYFIENLARTSFPKFIITDLNMPRLNGYEFIENIKKSEDLKHIPIFILSTCNDEKSRARALSAGANGYYVKPDDSIELKFIIESMMHQAN